MAEWIIACNPAYYDAVGAFHALKKVNWTQSQPLSNLAMGDIVYIYLAAPEKRIVFKCVANKVGLRKREINDDKYVMSDGTFDEADNYCELEMISELFGDEYKLENFSFTGVSTIQGPRHLTEQLKDYLDDCQRKGKLRILDQFRKAFAEEQIGSIFTRQEIVEKIVTTFATNPNSVLPSDYAYNMTNKGKPTSGVNFFINIDVGVYQYVGENFVHLNIEQILKAYKAAFPRVVKEETYKWVAVKQFQDNWDIDASDFAGMLSRSLSKADNLLNAKMYYPAGTIQDFARLDPDAVREMFRDLFDETDSISARYMRFRKSADVLLKTYQQTTASEKAKNHYQDLHAVSVYLAFRYPEKYYIYKSSVADTFIKLIGYNDSSKEKLGKLESYYRLCDSIHDQIIQDSELRQMQLNRITDECFADDQYRMLTMDVMYFCWIYNKVNGPVIDNRDTWFPSLEEYDPGITKEQWLALLNDPDVIGPIWGGFLAAFYQFPEGVSCKEIGEKYGRDPSSIAGNCTNLCKHIHKKTNCPVDDSREKGSIRYWSILFFGRGASKDEIGGFIWKLRPELYAALAEFDIMRLEWCIDEEDPQGGSGNDSLADGDVQNTRYWMYSVFDDDSWSECQTKGIMVIGVDLIGDYTQYESKEEIKQALIDKYAGDSSRRNQALMAWNFSRIMKPGDVIFAKKTNTLVGRGVVTGEYVFDETRSEYNSIRKVNWINVGQWEHPGYAVRKRLTDITAYTEYIEQLNALFDDMSEDTLEEPEKKYPPYSEEDFLRDVFMSTDDYHTLVDLLMKKKNIILQGAPGVGKTYAAKRLAYSIIGKKDQDRVMMIQFHQSYSYEDFIEGYRPTAEGFSIKKGAFYKFCKKAQEDDENLYFFIIDEINRGNLSKIFGELFMLIETDKRGAELQLLYSDDKFSVPANVHIIGMMNTADRSLAMLDYALRRRFAFIDMKPGFDTEGFANYRDSLENDKFNALIHCVQQLNHQIKDDAALGEGFCIGHSFFCNLTPDTVNDKELSNIVEFEIIPLLREYWFDEADKVADWSARLRGVVK